MHIGLGGGPGALGIRLGAKEAPANESPGPLLYLSKRYRQQLHGRFPFLVPLLRGTSEHQQRAQGQEIALGGRSMQGRVAFFVHGVYGRPSPRKGLQHCRVPCRSGQVEGRPF